MGRFGPPLRILIALTIAFSLLAIPNPGRNPALAGVPAVHAATAPNVPWVPAGPEVDTLTYPIFPDETSEFNALQAHTIDFTDWPLSPTLFSSFTSDPTILVTQAITLDDYFELEFNMANNFWGCNFNFGNPATQAAPLTTDCGKNIRQAFAHGMDKNQFITNELFGSAVPIDNPVPSGVDLNTPDSCTWDSMFPQTGTGCQVNGPGGTSYHLASASAGSGCANTPSFQYTPGCGTPDFCAAADHLIAAGLATGKNPPTAASLPCVLTGVQLSTINANPVQIFARSDNTPLLLEAQGYAQFLCALFTGSFSTGCGTSPSTTNIVNFVPGPITAFPGFVPCSGMPVTCTTISLNWWVYTAGFGNMLTFDRSLFFTYNSQFVSGFPGIQPPSGPCSGQSTPVFAPANYMWLCNPTYDSFSGQAEFAPCLTAVGDPSTGQTRTTVTFANCPGTSLLSSASAAYKAQDIFGQNANTIPIFTRNGPFAYLNGWQGGVLNKGNGFTPPGNYFTMLNAWNPSPPVSGTVRQGYSQATGSVNPFIGASSWDIGVMGSVWDSPGTTNPDLPQAYLDWMTIKTDQLPIGLLSYTPPTGTVAAFRYTLRNDIFWHTGQKVTAWDLAFSYMAYKSSGVGPGLQPMIGIKVLSQTQVDIDVNAIGPLTKLFLSSPVVPGRDWVSSSVCTASAWDAAANNPNFAAANTALTNCIAKAGQVTASGVLTPNPSSSNVDSAKIAPSYDPVAGGNLIGAGPWICGAGSSIGGPGCSSSGTGAISAGGAWTFTRYGFGTTPGGSLNTYFRSAGTLALWAWGRTTGIFPTDFLDFGSISLCFGKPVGTVGCKMWQTGIGASPTGIVGLAQVSIVNRFVGVNWVQPFDWRNSPPQNIAAFPPVLHEGFVTLNPCGIDPVNGYDC